MTLIKIESERHTQYRGFVVSRTIRSIKIYIIGIKVLTIPFIETHHKS